MAGAADAEITFERRRIAPERAARRIVDDGAALQYHNTIGKPQNLLCVLLDNDRADPPGAGNGAERPQKFLDNDGREALGRFIQHQQLQTIQFMKNMAIGGGLLSLAAFGGGPWSVDGWIAIKQEEAESTPKTRTPAKT